jgi:hypothetical protein
MPQLAGTPIADMPIATGEAKADTFVPAADNKAKADPHGLGAGAGFVAATHAAEDLDDAVA